jgi:hypothetical protein
VRQTSAVDLLCLAFSSLPVTEQDEALVRLRDIQLERLAVDEQESAVFLRALRRVAELNGGELSPNIYKRTRESLRRDGEELPYVTQVIRHFGSWARAKEATGLSETTTIEVIEARFRARMRGHKLHYREEELIEVLRACAAELGRPPLVAEYDDWREKELALARVRGELGRVPGPESFRRRFGTWEKTLVAGGFSPDDIYLRLEARDRQPRLAKVWRYSDETLAEVLHACARDLGHAPLVEEFEAWRQARLKRTRARAVGLPTNSPYRRRFGTWADALRHFGFSEAEIVARLKDGRARANAGLSKHAFRSTGARMNERDGGVSHD